MKTLLNINFDLRYWYTAKVHSVYDGDSVRLDIDMGFNQWRMAEKFRLARIDAWELRGEEKGRGIIARQFISNLLPVGREVTINTIKDNRGKYGRILVDIYDSESMLCVNDMLVEQGHATYKDY